ncbi:MAG: hypothetical protein MJ192_00935 [Clostridia bacterium]|nr:hypothetical protein [Clostridia bacterium]
MTNADFIRLPYAPANEELTVCGVPFSVERRDGVVRKLEGNHVLADGCFETLYFLGMSTDSWQCSEWWGQTEVQYDASIRLFFGDRVGRIRLIFDDRTEELISVLFGVNAFNYNLFFKPQDKEGNLMSFGAPYDEPFKSDPAARALLNAALCMTENTSADAEKMTKWVFAYKPRAGKKLVKIEWFKEEGKRADFVISAITGVPAGTDDTTGLPAVDLDFFLKKAWYAPVEALKRRVYTYLDEIPASVGLLDVPGFDAPDVRFYNKDGLDLFTNVYRKNIMDMAYKKVTDDGMPHTSSAATADFGCYIGFGTYAIHDSYGGHVWTRDIGRLLIELSSWGYFDRVSIAVDKLHELLYYPSVRFHIPHWKRVANLIARDENDLFNEGNENDGHASIMIAIYTYWRKSGVGKEWLVKNRDHLKAAADYYLWQEANPKQSNFDRILYSHSETSSQTYGGYDLYANVISLTALRMYARMFDELGENNYANELRRLADKLEAGVTEIFTLDHPKFGRVWTDTTDDCWTYEYKRFCALLMASDVYTLDPAKELPALFEIMTRTMAAQKELYYDPYSGRQMGYGQGYLSGAMLMLDAYRDYSDCVRASGNLCYHETDVPYIVPEGVIRHGSGQYWYRNSDLGNAVQQAEIVKEARLMVGVDDLDGSSFRLIPRLPDDMTAIEAKDVPVTKNGHVTRVSFRYARDGAGAVRVSDGETTYSLTLEGEKPEFVRVGPFAKSCITTDAALTGVTAVQGAYYAYITI